MDYIPIKQTPEDLDKTKSLLSNPKYKKEEWGVSHSQLRIRTWCEPLPDKLLQFPEIQHLALKGISRSWVYFTSPSLLNNIYSKYSEIPNVLHHSNVQAALSLYILTYQGTSSNADACIVFYTPK